MTLAVIPARGGSRELKHKNLLPGPDGTPLFLISARAARDAGCKVVVSTDDPQIRSLASANGFAVHWRGSELADVPVDEVVHWAVQWARQRPALFGALPMSFLSSILLVQPTVQPITARLLRWFLDQVTDRPATLGVIHNHLLWHDGQPLTDRVERQTSQAWPVGEVGVRWWPSLPLLAPEVVITAPDRLVDIDTWADWKAIDRRKTIGFHVIGNTEVGLGHVYRCLTLAERLQHHRVGFTFHPKTEQWVIDMVHERGWPEQDLTPDVLVSDVLDTSGPYAVPSVNLEDLGPGMHTATAVVNAMYGSPWDRAGRATPKGYYSGAQWADVRAEFLHIPYEVKPEADRVMILFGGTDPSALGRFAFDALYPQWVLDIIEHGENRSIAEAMQHADLLITSGGRTVFEAAAVGVPTLVMCQNLRETTHTHLGVGNINLGLGRLVTAEQLRHVVAQVLGDHALRADMSRTARASVDGRGVDRLVSLIEWVAEYGEAP